jgi:site-specific recombinase XerD
MTPIPSPGLPGQKLAEIFDARIRTLTYPHRNYQAAVHRFLTYLQTDFPQVLQLSQLRRDPHLLGWLRSFGQQEPSLSNETRRIYLVLLRRLLHDFASAGYPLQTGLILPQDFPPRPPLPRKLRPGPKPRPPLPHPVFGEIFDPRIQALAATLQSVTIGNYRVAARHFLLYLQTHFPHVRQLSELRRDPHWLGWLDSFAGQQPCLSEITRQKYRLRLRTLFQQLASNGHLLHDELLTIEDLPSPRRRACHELTHPTLGKIFETHIQTLATTLRPSTIHGYRHAARRFLSFLESHFPQLHELSELRRDPHWIAWLRSLCEQQPPLSNATRHGYLLDLGRLFNDLASQGHLFQPGLILAEDFPPRPRYLPRALSPEDDQRLQNELRCGADLLSYALLLTRATGIRIGECIDLTMDCLRLVGQDQWALHVPLGKLHTERLVPVDDDVRNMISRILTLRTESVHSRLANSATFLLPRPQGRARVYHRLSYALRRAAERAACPQRVTCHQLRHTYATEMVRLGVSLPALMKLLGHKDIRMTLRYVQVTQQDLQREYFIARRNVLSSQLLPALPLPDRSSSATSDVPGILQAIAATRHLLEMYRRQSGDEQTSKRLRRLARRLLSVGTEFRRFATVEK